MSQCVRSVGFAQVGIVGFDGQIELEALRLFGLPEAAPAVLYRCRSVPVGTRSLALEIAWDLPSLSSVPASSPLTYLFEPRFMPTIISGA
jgi:hypothetical protein